MEAELKGYSGKILTDVPPYRHIFGRAEIKSHGRWNEWQLSAEGSNLTDREVQNAFSHVTVRDAIPHIEAALREKGQLRYAHDDELNPLIEVALGKGVQTSISVSRHSIANVLQVVRDVLLDWTMRLEQEGILGKDFLFSENDRDASQAATQTTINNFQIGTVGTLVQNATESIVSGTAGN